MFSKSSQKKSVPPAASGTPSGGNASAGSGSGAVSSKAGVPSIISADLRIEGNLHSNGDVQVDGKVIGDIMSKTLTLGEGSEVKGAVGADTVRICGTVDGEVRASSVILTKTARVIGDVMHDSLAIEAGAYIDGHCRRIESSQTSEPTGAKASPNGSGAAEPVSSTEPIPGAGPTAS